MSHHQSVVSHAIRPLVSHIYHNLRLAGHPGRLKLYPSVKIEILNSPHNGLLFNRSVQSKIVQKSHSITSIVQQIQLLHESVLPDSVTIDAFVELIGIAPRNQYLLGTGDKFTKMIKFVFSISKFLSKWMSVSVLMGVQHSFKNANFQRQKVCHCKLLSGSLPYPEFSEPFLTLNTCKQTDV